LDRKKEISGDNPESLMAVLKEYTGAVLQEVKVNDKLFCHF